MKITLYLMTQKGFEVLQAITSQNRFIALISEVIVGRDKSIDNDFADEIITLCNSLGIKYYERNQNYIPSSDYSIAISWRWMIQANASKLIVLHDSILPRYRGFAPLVNMLINEEKEIGVTAIFASDEYDKGDIIYQAKTIIQYPVKISRAMDLISRNYVEIIEKILTDLSLGNKLIAVPQDEKSVSYSLWRNEEDYLMDWSADSRKIINFINAVSSPYKGASSYINGLQ